MSGSPTLRAFSLEGQCPKAGSEWAIMLGKEMSSHCRVIASPIFDAPTWRGYKRSQRKVYFQRTMESFPIGLYAYERDVCQAIFWKHVGRLYRAFIFKEDGEKRVTLSYFDQDKEGKEAEMTLVNFQSFLSAIYPCFGLAPRRDVKES